MGEWDDWIGRTTTTSARLDPAVANRLAVTLDRKPRFADGDELPPAWHWLYLHDLVRAGDLGEDGHPRLGISMPPLGLPRRMWAGGRLAFEAPLRLGTMVERTTTIRSITPKEGRSGRLCFVALEHDIRTDGVRNLLEEQSIVYREAPSNREVRPAAPAVAASPPADPAFTTAWDLDPVALFRYSALTFNGHRIHYDADYCRDVEGYPGPVVHGPLLATLLLDLALREGRHIGTFTYRAKSPVFLGRPFAVHGRPEGEGTVLWATDPDGGLAMEADLVPA